MRAVHRISGWMTAPLLAAQVLAAALAGAQPLTPVAPEVPAVDATAFADFPTPSAELSTLAPRWPARLGFAEGDRGRGVIVEFVTPHAKPVMQNLSFSLPPSGPERVRGMEEIIALAGEKRPVSVLREGTRACVVAVPALNLDDKESKPFRAAMTFEFVSGASLGEADGVLQVGLERTVFSLIEPGAGKTVKGVALLMPGLFGTPPGTLDGLTKALNSDGWCVLRMWAQPSRFTEIVNFEIDLSKDVEAQAGEIARATGERLSECAFAVQSAFDHVEKAKPELAKLPRVAIGFSGGALSLPTVVAREPDRYSAFVMVGGGADSFLMTLKTAYTFVGGPKFTFVGEKPTNEQLLAFDRAYLERAPQDSYHTAALLKGRRVLMFNADGDTAVPAPLGNLLWERAGRPERVIHKGRHESLFFTLPAEFGRIREFLSRAAEKAAG
ncbi:MAG: hypothetical protein ACOYN0_06180 [Phycisphaerales bacterium]